MKQILNYQYERDYLNKALEQDAKFQQRKRGRVNYLRNYG